MKISALYIGRAMKICRLKLGLKQGDLAKTLEKSSSYLSEVEAGKRNVSYDFVSQYAKAIGINTSNLIVLSERLQKRDSSPAEEQPIGLINKLERWILDDFSKEEGSLSKLS